jgi:hypothetical protein
MFHYIEFEAGIIISFQKNLLMKKGGGAKIRD